MKANIILIILCAAVLSACAGKPKEPPQASTQSAQVMYQQAKDVLDSGLYNRAIELLREVESRHPFGPVARQVQLDLIFAYYQSGNVPQALASIDRFIRLNPNQPDLDYVYYMRGMSNLKTDENTFQEFFGVDRADRDLSSTRQAFEDFKILVTNYPDSKYSDTAKRRMVEIKDTLARHELLVADYYLRRGAYLAAANRGKYVVEYFRDSPLVEQALEVMVESYGQLGLTKLRDDSYQVLKLNFPDNQRF
ncbi:outer membrane protein assembly factor BamD [Arsukibacterium sp.]|uniref:outer membrane protein assembly factor BamD n=1 Tax=Arsukibacterium sp. TaxID=1977258 RepID=UPI002FDAC8BE